jgi:hypothetical protein
MIAANACHLLVLAGLLFPPVDRTTSDVEPAVLVSLAEASPVLGVHEETELRIRVVNPPATELPMPRILCSEGHVEDMVRDGPARFSGHYVLSTNRFPRVAILVVEFATQPRPVRAIMGVRLRAAASPVFRTDPGSQVTLTVGDKEFGPEQAGADGMVRVPVVVPPGVDFGQVRSVNRHGRASEQLLDLKIPPGPRILIDAPTKMLAGQLAEVRVYAVEPTGRLAEGRRIGLRSSFLPAQVLSRGPGETAFLVRAPAILDRSSIHLDAQLEGEPNTATAADIGLQPATAAQISLEPDASRLSTSPDASLRVFLAAQDAFGNRLDPGPAAVLVDNVPSPIQSTEDGRAMVLVRPPIVVENRRSVEVEAVMDSGHTVLSIPLLHPARKVPPWWTSVPAPRYTLTSRMGVFWHPHQLPGAAFLLEGLSHRGSWPGHFAFGAAIGLLHQEVVASNDNGATQATLEQIPVLALARYMGRRERLTFSAGGGAGIVATFACLRSFETSVREHGVGVVLEGFGELGLLMRSGQFVAGVRYLAIKQGHLSGGDEIVGNAGGLIGDVGYRLVW